MKNLTEGIERGPLEEQPLLLIVEPLLRPPLNFQNNECDFLFIFLWHKGKQRVRKTG